MAGESSQIQKSVRVRASWQISLVGIQEINYIELNMSKSIRWDMLKQASKNSLKSQGRSNNHQSISLPTSVLVFLCIYFDQKSLRGFRQRKNNFQGKNTQRKEIISQIICLNLPNYVFGPIYIW